MRFPLYIAKRYLFTKSSNNAINVISIIAAFGVIVGAAALFIVLSGFAGLKDFSLQFSSFVDPDLKIVPAQGKSIFVDAKQLAAINDLENVASTSTVVEERVVINYDIKHEIVTLKGIDSSYPQATVDSILSQGRWLHYNSNQIVSGRGIANNLAFGVFQFDKPIKIYVPRPGVGQMTSVEGAYNSVSAINSGVFQINEDLDNSMVYSSIDIAKALLNYEPNQYSAIEVWLKDQSNVESVVASLNKILGDSIVIKNRFQLNDALYKMLNTEHLAVYLIFTLVLIIALFNLVGSIIMMILDKKKNLKTLYSLGVPIKDIRRVFFYQGSLTTIYGGLLGVSLGFLLVFLQKSFGMVLITPSLPYPVSIKLENFVIVLATIFVLGVLASKIASVRITKKLVWAN